MKRYAIIFLGIAILGGGLVRPAMGQQPVDVLVAMAPGSFEGDSLFISGLYEAGMLAVLANSNMLDKQFRFRPYLLVAGVIGSAPHESLDVLNFIASDADSLLSNARDTTDFTLPLTVTSYDLVIVVVESLVSSSNPSNFICGSARVLYDSVNGAIPGSDPPENRFAIVISDSPICRLNRARLVAHEIGHIFGGDHQAPINGQEVDTFSHTDDDDTTIPINYNFNHPKVKIGNDGDPVYSTAMGGSGFMFPIQQFSSNSDLIFMNGDPAGDSGANMKGMIDAWWDTVSAYRPVQTCSLTTPIDVYANLIRTCQYPPHSQNDPDRVGWTKYSLRWTDLCPVATTVYEHRASSVSPLGPWTEFYSTEAPAVKQAVNVTADFWATTRACDGQTCSDWSDGEDVAWMPYLCP